MPYELKKKAEVDIKQGNRNELYELFEQMTTEDCIMFYDDDPNYDKARQKFTSFYKKVYKSVPPKGMLSYVAAVDDEGRRGKALSLNMNYNEASSNKGDPSVPKVIVG